MEGVRGAGLGGEGNCGGGGRVGKCGGSVGMSGVREGEAAGLLAR